jgi:cytochrome P450 family 6
MALIFWSLTLSLITFTSAFFIYLYFYFTRNFKYWEKLGIPYVKPLPFVGSMKEVLLLRENIGKTLQRIYNEHSDKPFVGIFMFDQPGLVICDLDLVKNILVKDAQYFIDRVLSVDENLDPLFGKVLSVLNGQRWRQIRMNLTPVFTSAKMKLMFHLVKICGKELVKYLDTATAKGK